MTVFNNNTKNSRDLICDSLQLNGGYKGQVLQSGDNGQLVWSTQQNISSLPFIQGVTLAELQMGHAWLKSNGKDESVKLQELIDNTNGALTDIKLSPDALRTFTLESPTGFIFLDSFLTIPSNTSINFNSYIAGGNEFRLQIAGNSSELPPTLSNAPKIISNCPQGSTSITVNANGYNMSSWTSNDYIALRSTSKNKRQDNQILSIVPTSSNIYNITLRNATDDFSIASNDGTVRKYVYFTLNSNASRGDCRVYVSGSGFTDLSVGGYVTIQDRRMAGDIVGSASNITHYQTSNPYWYSNNKFKQNTRQVIQIDAINGFIHLDSPLSVNFDTTNAYMLILKPKENIKVSGLKLFYIQQPTYPRPNNHAVLLDTCVNCEVENMKFSDKWAEIPLVTMYPNMDNLIRIRESYNCHVRDVDLLRSQNSFSDSGSGYGITQYYSSYCTFSGVRANGFRHNFLIQGGDHTKLTDCVFRNVLISGLDSHGLGSTDTLANNIYIDFSDGIGAILEDGITKANSTIAGVRVGNSTHPIGDSYGSYNNITIKGGHAFSNIATYYGVELVSGYNSGYNQFNNLQYIDGDTGIAIYDHPRGRLNSNLMQQSNDFNNCAFINCKETLDINGSYNSSNSYAYLETYANSATSNSVRIRSTDSITDYNNVFNGWVLRHNTSNYTVSTYSASNKQLILTTNFGVIPSSNDALILKDSLVESIYPCRDILLQNSIIESNITQCLINFSLNPRIVKNYFSKSGDTSARYAVDIKNSFNGSILNNTLHYPRRFMQMSNCSNLEIISNHSINAQETNILSDLGSNVSVQWVHNSTTGFIPTYTTSASTTYITGNTFLGYKATPKAPLLTFDNTNGYIGLTQEKPLNPLHISATNNLPVCIETTSSSYCAISLQDSNTTNSNMVQVRSSNNSMVLRSSNADTLWLTGGRLGIGKQRTAGRVHLYENTGTTTFLHFDNSNVVANGSNINTQVAGAYWGRVAVSVEGQAGTKYISIFNP